MHKPHNAVVGAAITAIAMFAGATEYTTQDELFGKWVDLDVGGGVELYAELAGYAALSESIVEELIKLTTAWDFPGVFDYEVSEELGGWFADIVTGGRCPDEAEAKLELGRLFVDFFSNSAQFSVDPRGAALIRAMTGYSKE